jgi:hypothetical protein
LNIARTNTRIHGYPVHRLLILLAAPDCETSRHARVIVLPRHFAFGAAIA